MFKRSLTNAALIAGVTFGIRGLGLLRDALLAKHFGISVQVDDFFLILSWVYFLTSVFATSAMNFMIPKIKDEFDSGLGLVDASRKYFYQFNVGLFFIGTIFIVGVGSQLTAFDFAFAIVGAGIFYCQSVNHFLSAILNLRRKFLYPASLFALPVVMTLLPFFMPDLNSFKLLYYFLFGSISQLVLILFIFLIKNGFNVNLWLKSEENIFELSLIKKWLLTAMATFYFPATELINVLLAEPLETGSIATLNYAMRIPMAISSIIIYAVWTVALPAAQIDSKKLLARDDYKKVLKVVAVTFIFSVFSYVMSPIIVETVYGIGNKINSIDMHEIVTLQKLFFLALPLQIAVNLILRFIHTNGRTLGSIIISAVGLFIHVSIFNLTGENTYSIAYGFICNFVMVIILLLVFSNFLRQRSDLNAG